jgi:diguanylate cyclase (GGDEF)-like protein/PAS domain S-box-containing protein
MLAVIGGGLVCLLCSAVRLPLGSIDISFLALCVTTIIFGSYITVQIPRLKSHISVSDTVVFLALLLYGGELAVVLAAFEALCSSLRFCSRKITILFNASVMAISVTTTLLALNLFGLTNEGALHGHAGHMPEFIESLSVIAITPFIVNTALAAIHGSLKNNVRIWEIWKDKYALAFFSYFLGAVCAGVTVRLTEKYGFSVMLAIIPVIFFIFLSYRMYRKSVEVSHQQANQAREYAALLEKQAAALRGSEERFRSAFDNAPIGIALVSRTGRWLRANRALGSILGYSEREFLASDIQSLILPDDFGDTLQLIRQVLAGITPSCQMDQRFLHRSGNPVWVTLSISLTTKEPSDDAELIFQIQDITNKKQVVEKLQYEATHDALTAIPNRNFFLNRLTTALYRSQNGSEYGVSVLFIDLDHFKQVNDTYGHQIGDQLLIRIAERLRVCVRPSDVVARFGGDEFVILVEGCYERDEVVGIAERVRQEFSVPFFLGEHEVYSSASIGILHASESHLTANDMMRDADRAMYIAKRSGKAQHAVFDQRRFHAKAA